MMSTSPQIKRRTRTLANVLILAIGGFTAVQAYPLAAVYRTLSDTEQQLPKLPAVRRVTQQSKARFRDKIWVHRVNSIERAGLMARQYKGMEIDVVYDSAADYFDVGHPPAPSQGISLERLFGAVPDIADHYFWIDFKNLSDVNKDAACERLSAIGRKYGVVGHTVVESTNPRALSCFSDRGFYTSYYLFPESDIDQMNTEQLTNYYEEVKANLIASRVNALSSSYHSLPFIQAYFPDSDILLWYVDSDKRLTHYASLAYLRLQPHVKVILVKRRGPGYR